MTRAKTIPRIINPPGTVAQKLPDQGKNFSIFTPFLTGIEIEPKEIISLNKKKKNKDKEKSPEYFIFWPNTFGESYLSLANNKSKHKDESGTKYNAKPSIIPKIGENKTSNLL